MVERIVGHINSFPNVYTSLHKATEAAREIYRNELRQREATNSVSPEVYRTEKIGTLIPNDSCLRGL